MLGVAYRGLVAPDLDFSLDPPLDRERRSALVQLWTDVSNAGGAVGFVPPVTQEEVEPMADAAFADVVAGRSHLVVASQGGQPVGLAFIEPGTPPLFSHWAVVRRLQIHPEAQGRGLGSRLLEAVEQAGREVGLEQLRLAVRGGTGTEDFYLRQDWRHIATIPRTIRVAPGDDRDQLWLVKDL